MKEGEMKYVRGKDKYIPIGRDRKPVYERKRHAIVPTYLGQQHDQYHADFYAEWLNLEQDTQSGKYEAPT
ncbi:MAG: hypothetical protein IPM85_11505 [Chitinophagaceae bacterium]|nr:hypothetical protein [Chitinophagaceae bacterium]